MEIKYGEFVDVKVRLSHAAELLRKIEPFPTTTDLKPYDPGWAVPDGLQA